jgi:hypothetical protein
MEYVAPVVIVVLIVTGFLAFLVLNATRKSGPAAYPRNEGAREGSGQPDPDEAAHLARPGEAEGAERLRFEPVRPAGERRR